MVKSVEEIGEELVELYDAAELVEDPVNVNVDESTAIKTLKYKTPSPDFCEKNKTIGVLGVEGRRCEPNHPTNNCTTLCCGRDTNTVLKEVEIEECEFQWCCSIKCRIVRTAYVHVTTCL